MMKIKEAIVLAGGLGTRLQSVIQDVPKPMAPINGRPFLCYVLDWLLCEGIHKCILAVGYKRECIIDFFGGEYNGMHLTYSVEEEPLGTGGAIQKAFTHCSAAAVIVNGDTLFPVDLALLTQKYRGNIVLACRYMADASRYGVMRLQGDLVTGFDEKKNGVAGWVNGGVYIANKLPFCDYTGKFSMEMDVLPKCIREGKVYAMKSDAYFIDIGVPEDYRRAQAEL